MSVFGRILFGFSALLVAGGVGVYVWLFADLPAIDRIEAGMALPSTRIYDRNGTLLYEILPPQQGRHTPLTLEDVPPMCINAVIAVEDVNYWHHVGVDLVGIARALWLNVRYGQVVAGGSTITQQTARLLLLSPQERASQTLERKLREAILAIQLEQLTSKEHVLALYLNQAYFGNLAYGLEAAARTYFHKGASELALHECALLAGMLQNATYYDPLVHTERARERQATVLNLMVQAGFLDEATAQDALADPLQFGSTPFPIQAPHAVMAVWTQLQRHWGEALYTQGLDVVTTIDLNWTRTAERIARAQLYYLNTPEEGYVQVAARAHNAALVAIDPHTGQVLTMLGSPDYFDRGISGAVNATLAMRQPGSALKPFTYAVAMNPKLDAPYTPATMMLDVRTPFITERLESYVPANYGFAEHGVVSLRTALGSSYNIPAVNTLAHIGIHALVDLLGRMGMPYLADNHHVDLSITLGGGEVRLFDLTQAYATFANGGHYVDPSLLLKVSTRGGEVLYEWQPPEAPLRVLDERVAYLITDILADNHARLSGFGNPNPLMIGRPAAAKTGTTTDFRDNWVVGYTPNLVVGVWVGNADNQPMVNVTGITGAAPIYHQFMRTVLQGQPVLSFDVPDGLVQVEVCVPSGMLPGDVCPHTRLEWFIEGTQPTQTDTLHERVAIDARTGELAHDGTPEHAITHQIFLRLPPQAHDWAQREGVRFLPAPPDHVSLLSPDPHTVYELSPVLPANAQRIRLRASVPQGVTHVTYRLNGTVVGQADAPPYDLWWQLTVGDYALIARAHYDDGRIEDSEALFFRVVPHDPTPRLP